MTNTNEEEWYIVAKNDPVILQGDLLDDFLAPFPKSIDISKKEPECSYEMIKMDAVVISQSCDTATKADDDDQIVVCQRHFLADVFKSKSKLKEAWPNLVKDRVINKLLINNFDHDELGFDYSFIDFSKIFVVPHSYASEFASKKTKRIRMNSPYRERLSQAFSRKFMRVGLPINILESVPNIEFTPITTFDQE